MEFKLWDNFQQGTYALLIVPHDVAAALHPWCAEYLSHVQRTGCAQHALEGAFHQEIRSAWRNGRLDAYVQYRNY